MNSKTSAIFDVVPLLVVSASFASVQGSVDNDAAASPSGAVASKWCWATQPETKNMRVVDAQYHIQHQTT